MFFNINLTFNQQNYSIQLPIGQFKKLIKDLPDSIAEQMVSQQNIDVKSAVKTENFLQFVRYLSESLEPKINSENAYDFFLLNQEFQILTDYLSDKTDMDIYNLSALCSNANNDKSQNEKFVAMHLDDCVENHEQELLKIPFNSLVNIFFHKERILNDHQKAYDFIIKESFSNISLYILLESLDGEKLNIKSQFESISKIKERSGYLPTFNQAFYESIMKKCEKLPELEKENQKLREEINKLTDQNNSIEDIESFILSIKDKVQTEKGKTIIHWACENNRPDIVEYAISKKKKTIDINSVCTSLQSSGNAKKIDMSYEKTALHSAIENNNIDIVKMLLSSPEIDVNAHYKCKNCELVIGLEFVEEDYKKTALHLAIENNNIDIVKVLVSSSEFDCNAYYKYRRFCYILAGLFNCTIDNYEKTALHLAIENNNIDIINFLISLPKIDVNAYYKHSDYEKTALHLAIENNNIDIVKILLSSPEIDVNAYYKHKDSRKSTTALHMAVENKYIEIIACLLESKRIDVNKKDGQGRKPFEITNDPKIRSLF